MLLNVAIFKRKLTALLTILVTLISVTSLPTNAVELKPFELELKAKRFSPFKMTLSGKTYLKQSENGIWDYRTYSSKGVAKLDESVSFLFENLKVKPLKYKSRTRVMFFKESKDIRYNYDKSNIDIRVDRKSSDFDISPLVYDPLSFQVQLMANLPFENESEIFPVFRYNRPVNYRFINEGIEILQTPMGNLKAIKLTQTKGNRKNESKSMWLAVDWNFAPIRFEAYKKGKLIDQIETISGKVAGEAIRGIEKETL